MSSTSYPIYTAPATNQTAVTAHDPQSGRLIKQITDQLFTHVVPANTEYALFDDTGNGALMGFEISVNIPDVNLQIYIYADNPTVPNYVNNLAMDQLLSLGRGLTPGDVTLLPSLQTQDIMGKPSPIYPYLARYKDDLQPDYTGFSDKQIVLRFEPSVYVAYKRIVGNIINTNGTQDATIQSLDIKRLIYQDILPSDVPPPDPNKGVSNVRRTVALPVSRPNYKFSPQKPRALDDEIAYSP